MLQIPAMFGYWGASKKKMDDAGARPRERQTERRILAATIRMGAWAGGLIRRVIRERSNARDYLVSRLRVLGVIAPVRIHVGRIPIRNCY